MPPYFVSLEDLRKGVDWATTLERQFKIEYAFDKRLPGNFSTAPAPTSHQIFRVRPPSDPAQLSVLIYWSRRKENPACLEKCWACGKWRAELGNEWIKGMWGWWVWNTLEDSNCLLTCLLGNPYTGQEATVRTGRGTTDWFKIELSDSTTTSSLRANFRRSKLTNLHKYVIAWCPWRVIRLKWLFMIEDL